MLYTSSRDPGEDFDYNPKTDPKEPSYRLIPTPESRPATRRSEVEELRIPGPPQNESDKPKL